MASTRRLKRIQNALAPTITSIGTLTLGNISYPVPASVTPSRLPHFTPLDPNDPRTREHLYFLLQKFILGQDVFLVAQPGPYARRLALTFCSMMNAEYEYIALHRDVGETELKQGREIREGGNLVYVDSASVRAVKTGRILIIEGIEKAERGIMPVLNNLLENREINLDDGTHILHPHRHILLPPADAADARFVPAHPSFRVIAIGAPVPPYTGYPLDPPFRSRFQARFLDPTSALLAYPDSPDALPEASAPLWKILRDLVLATQYASEARHVLDGVARSALPPFPQTALAKLHTLLTTFPPPSPIASGSRPLSPRAMGRLMIVLHPELLHAPFQAWALLSERLEEAGLGPLAAPLATEDLDDPGTAVEDATGLLGYTVRSIERTGKHSVRVVFTTLGDGKEVVLEVPAGEGSLRPFPLEETPDFVPSARFVGLLTNCLQAHALGWDISLVPPAQPATASASTSLLVHVLGDVLGYVREAVHVYKELGGRELLMRRVVGEGGATSWEPSPLVQGAWAGRLVHFSGLDVLGPTAGAIARLLQDREIELWEGKRIVASLEEDETNPDLSTAHPSFRVISTASRAAPLRDWLSSEHANMFLPVPAQPMGRTEEAALLIRTGCPPANVDTLLTFAGAYRTRMAPADGALRVRRLGTRALLRIARRLAQFPWDQDVRSMLERALLTDFLPTTEKVGVEELLEEVGIHKITPAFHPPPVVVEDEADRVLLFPAPTDPLRKTKDTRIPRFETASDPEGVASFVPHMDHFYNNSIQSAQMRDLAIDFELLQDHLVLLGNQGVGKNKIVDRLCQLLQRPREYIQLHRDSTVQQLMFHTTLERGVIRYTDSPLLRAVAQGRVLVVDEVDKAPEHVVAIFRSLAGQGELTLSDGRRLTHVVKRDGDLPIHPNFRLILLANRPGYPFLGNHFMQVLGDNFSCHAISNPDLESERRLLTQLAPELDENLITRLIGAFHDLRQGYESGSLAYPYSLRELIAIVRHMRAYPDDDLDDTLRNVFDFDVYRIETTEKLDEILRKHGLRAEDVNFTEQTKGKRKQLDMQFDPEKTDLDKPKHGQEDPNGGAHSGGNAFAGGTGGRDTAGMGGRGGFKRLYKKGHDIYQVSKKLKDDVPESVRAQARLMARKELEARLAALNITSAGANSYGALLSPVQAHIAQLQDLLEHLAAREEERVWVKRQTDGELDDTRLTEGLTGEAAVYKRRGMAKPELGRPQVKPKRIRFVFDISASMYRFQYDGRLQRSLETAVMLMESFNLLTRKDKYKWDMYGHSGDEPEIPLVNIGDPIEEVSQRWAVTQKMKYTTQYTWSGDTTVAAIEKAVNEVAAFDGDDHFVIALTDANFGQYNITAEDLGRAMNRHPKVKTALICICEDSEASWVKKHFPGRAFLVTNSADIPKVLRGFLTTMVDK